MLVQGSNCPIVLQFDDDPSTFLDMSVLIYPRGSDKSRTILSWGIEDVVIDGNNVILPISQSDLLPPNLTISEDTNIAMEVKWLDSEEGTEHSQIIYDFISHREDSTIMVVTENEGS